MTLTITHCLLVVFAGLPLRSAGEPLPLPAPLVLQEPALERAGAQDPRGISMQTQADLLFSKQDWPAAGEAYRKLTEKEPANAQGWYRLGYCLHAQKRLAEAIVAHRKAAEFPAVAANALYNLGCAHALLRQNDPAFDALGRAVDAGFKDVATFEKDPDLESLRTDTRFAALRARMTGSAPVQNGVFDFWVGEWNVVDPAGKTLGSNRIVKAERGNVLMEHWTDAKGSTGRSMNYFDPLDGLWHQVWVADDGGVSTYTGEMKDGSMRFLGTQRGLKGGSMPTRMTFTPLANGDVRQFIENSKDGGKTWTPSFEGIYKRKKT